MALFLLSPGGDESASGGASGITIEQMSQGVSREGMEAVLGEVKVAMIDTATENLNNYTSLHETVKMYWQGTDCDQWCDNFVHLVNEIVASLEGYYEQIEAEFQKVFDSWEEFQSENVTTGY